MMNQCRPGLCIYITVYCQNEFIGKLREKNTNKILYIVKGRESMIVYLRIPIAHVVYLMSAIIIKILFFLCGLHHI